jgi:glutamyl-tRNA reductase
LPVVVIGLNHRTVPLAVLERAAVPADRLGKVLDDLVGRPNVLEALVLSTCNRTEVYVQTDRFHGAYQDVRDALCDLMHLGPESLNDHLYSEYDLDAVAHLFRVAAGLDSAVLGEHEILGQVRSAWDAAAGHGAARTGLHRVFRHAVEVGKRARTETAIARGTASVSHAAVEMATEHLGPLVGRRVLVVGAGEMGEGMAVSLAAAGVADVLVANRTPARADALADRVGGRAIALDAVADALRTVDLVLSGTGADGVVLEHDVVADAMADRSTRPLLVVDVAVPRDIDPGVGQVPGVTLLDLDDLRRWADRGRQDRQAEVTAVEAIVVEEVARHAEDLRARQVAPVIAALHERAESLRQAELDRFAARLGELDERQRAAVDQLTRSLLAKVLHTPTTRLKADAGSAVGERNALAVRELFEL